MKKMISGRSLPAFLFSALALIALLAGVSSCNKDRDMDSLLERVPADSPVVFTFNANEVLKQLDYNDKGEHATYCNELKELLRSSEASTIDVNKITDGLDLTEKSFVGFLSGMKFIFVTKVSDEKKFRRWAESVSKKEFEKVGSGAYELDNEIVLKDGYVWLSPMGLTASDIKQFEDLGDKSFAAKHEKVASSMCESDMVFCGFADINRLLSLARLGGALNEVSAVQLVLGTAFKDASYITVESTLSSDGIQGELTVLNSSLQPAEFLIPMGKIDSGAMSKVNNNAFLVGAVDFSPELMKMLSNLVDQYASGMRGERYILDLLLQLNGTSAVSVNNDKDVLASLSFKDEKAASELGQFLSSERMPASVSTRGNFLLIRTPDASSAGGNTPREFDGNFIGIAIDYANPNATKLMGADLSNLGRVYLTLGSKGKGVCLKSRWEMKEPVKNLLRAVNKNLEVESARRASYYNY